MQLMGCSRSLFARFNVACRVRRFYVSRPAATSYPKNKEWDYFKGIIPMSAVASRRWFQGSRTLAEQKVDHLRAFKHLMDSGYEVDTKLTHGSTDRKQDYPKLTDGSDGHAKVDVEVLKGKNLFLFFSSLDISNGDYIRLLNLVYDEVRNRGLTYKFKIVWIPVVKQWNEHAQNDFVMLRSNMPWYTMSPKLEGDIKNKWGYKGKPILVVMDAYGDVEITDAFPLIRDKGVQNFPFDDVSN
ncbi:protein SIEVE ELEMENT OCCLUSION B-like [Prunus avium]|uniref:Protein SIEVE ELEMENT OCCLUSION B-like n=1 Tax=Prunus avium TaxID=42229 RepID=A0A6P5T4L8_PRUAV|nr:protein SIEVE ELEMENT OCCLUSION B-like [Prunus avium]